jgi:hypothetical protein
MLAEAEVVETKELSAQNNIEQKTYQLEIG